MYVHQNPFSFGTEYKMNYINSLFISRDLGDFDKIDINKDFRKRVRSYQLLSNANLLSKEKEIDLKTRLDCGITQESLYKTPENEMEELEFDFTFEKLEKIVKNTALEHMKIIDSKRYEENLEKAVDIGFIEANSLYLFNDFKKMYKNEDEISKAKQKSIFCTPIEAKDNIEKIGKRLYEFLNEENEKIKEIAYKTDLVSIAKMRKNSYSMFEYLIKLRSYYGRLAMLDGEQIERISRNNVSPDTMKIYINNYYNSYVLPYYLMNKEIDPFTKSLKTGLVNSDNLDVESGIGQIMRDQYSGISLLNLYMIPDFKISFINFKVGKVKQEDNYAVQAPQISKNVEEADNIEDFELPSEYKDFELPSEYKDFELPPEYNDLENEKAK